MRRSWTIHLHGQWNEQRELCLWGVTPTGETISPLDLKLLLFAGDPALWYGAHADTWEDGAVGGVKLSAEKALDYWSAPTYNPLLVVQLSDDLQSLRQFASLGCRTGFRLDDPDRLSGEDRWTLTFVLIDRQSPSVAIDCDSDGKPIDDVPAAWSLDVHAARMLLAHWLEAVPFLADPHRPETLRAKLDDSEAWTFLTEIGRAIADMGGAVLLPSWWNRLRAARPKLKARLQPEQSASELALFGLDQMVGFDWKLAVGDSELTEEEFWSIAEEQKPLHFIRGQWIALDRELIAQIRKTMERSKRRKGIPLREALLRKFGHSERQMPGDEPDTGHDSPDWEVEAEGALLRWMNRLNRLETVPAVPVSSRFQGELRSYQAEGLSWLVFLRGFGLGGCLADDMGLGKTIQYIAYLLHVKERDSAQGPSLLICPTSLVGNWQKELERFAPDLRIYLHYGAGRIRDRNWFADEARHYDIVLTTYMTAMLDIGALQAFTWNSLCLDEAQNMKNAHTKQASAIRRLTAVHRIAMTGTPVENRLSELWSIIDFVNPGYLGSQSVFGRQFGRLSATGKDYAAKQLHKLIRPFVLRRMKTDPKIVPDLPEKVEGKVYIPLTKEQAALYENVIERLFEGLDKRKGIDRRGNILAALTQLKQICDHPVLFTKDRSSGASAPRYSHKSERLLEMVSELRAEGDRCLIFTQYAEMGFLLQRMLERTLKEPILYLHGGTPKEQRDRMVERFQNPKGEAGSATDTAGIFVLSLRAGGTGLNLTAANHVFHYDRWWNPAVENQATDRAYRIGQRNLVQVHKFISLGTLEEKIDEMIEKKQNLSRSILDASDSWITELSTNELRELFTLRRSWIDG